MYKIAAIGDRNSVYGFASLGLSVFFVTEPHEAKVTVKKLVEEAIIKGSLDNVSAIIVAFDNM